jgi:hypothetical protein
MDLKGKEWNNMVFLSAKMQQRQMEAGRVETKHGSELYLNAICLFFHEGHLLKLKSPNPLQYNSIHVTG